VTLRECASVDDIHELTKTSAGSGFWSVKVWPTCGEASLTWRPQKKVDVVQALVENFAVFKDEVRLRAPGSVEDNEDRAVRRARSAVRRYSRHNGLNQMVTFTFAGDVPEFNSLSEVVANFWKRWERRAGRRRGAYVWVPEWGKVTGRLHIHMAVPWWRELNCVEVCPRCDRYDVLSSAGRGVPRNYLCVGCCWGHGFVGRPLDDEGEVETNEDGRSLSRYLSKYMAKDLGSELTCGQQRYRCAEGFAPTCVDELVESPDEGVSMACDNLGLLSPIGGQSPIMYVTRPTETWNGPPIVLLDWLAKSPKREETECDSESSS